MNEPQSPCPPDSELMKAWRAYQATDDFTNSLYWATTLTTMRPERAEELGIEPRINAVNDKQRENFATGSLWAAFVKGFEAAGGKVRF